MRHTQSTGRCEDETDGMEGKGIRIGFGSIEGVRPAKRPDAAGGLDPEEFCRSPRPAAMS